MKTTNLFMTTAIAMALSVGAAAAQDLGSSSFAAGVSLLSPDQTGYLFSGSVEAQGLGTGAVVLSNQNADFNMTGFANSNGLPSSLGDEAVANSGVLTTFDFDRTVTASASSIGTGRVVAKGDANGAVGAVGSAFGETEVNEIVTTTGDGGGGTLSSTADAASESAASLVGEGSTSVLAGLIGTSNNFVGSTGTSVTTTQDGVAYSALNVVGNDAGTGINIDPGSARTFDTLSGELAILSAGQGRIGFINTLDIGTGINLSVSNVGGGTISLGATTGGFFGGGSATSGSGGFGSVFEAATGG